MGGPFEKNLSMSYTLSALDLSPVSGDGTQAQGVRDTIEVAKAAERLLCRRVLYLERLTRCQQRGCQNAAEEYRGVSFHIHVAERYG